MEATVPWLQKAVTDDVPSNFKSMAEIEDEIGKKYEFFKQFDTVEDFSDHHYADKPVGKVTSYAYQHIDLVFPIRYLFLSQTSLQTGKEWTKRIQHDWKLLENDLPGQLFPKEIVKIV